MYFAVIKFFIFLFNTVIYVFLLLCLCIFIVCLYIFIVLGGTLRLPWLGFFRAFSSVVRQIPGYNSQSRGTARTLLKLSLLFYVLFVVCHSVYCLFCAILCIVCFVPFCVLFVLCHSVYCLCVNVYCTAATGKSKGKAIPLQACSGPEGSRKFRFPGWCKVVSLRHRPPLPQGNTPGTHFC
jgi:hypothetical protein